jgi:hypothetical protein
MRTAYKVRVQVYDATGVAGPEKAAQIQERVVEADRVNVMPPFIVFLVERQVQVPGQQPGEMDISYVVTNTTLIDVEPTVAL